MTDSKLPPPAYFEELAAMQLLVPRAKVLAALADAYGQPGAALPLAQKVKESVLLSPQRKPAAVLEPILTPAERQAVEALCDVAEAAFHVADDSPFAGDSVPVGHRDMDALVAAMDKLGSLTKGQPDLAMLPGESARRTLRRLLVLARVLQAPAATPGDAVRSFRDYLGTHDGIKLGGHAMDDMALDLARIALDFKHLVSEPAPAAAAPKGVVAWMHPGTLDVILDERKVAWMDCYGAGEKAKAERYTVPLGHIGQPGAVIDAASDLIALRDEYAQKTQNAVPGNEYWGARFDAKYQALAAALAAAPALEAHAVDAAVVWPKMRDVGRIGDMSPSAHLRIGLDSDNDVYASIYDERGGGSIEFCTPGAGGGNSSRTRKAMIALMVAMEADNAADPRRDWWAERNGAAQAQQKGPA